MFTIHEKRIRRAKKARAHQDALKTNKHFFHYALPDPKPYTIRPGAPVGPKKSLFQNVVSFFKGGRA